MQSDTIKLLAATITAVVGALGGALVIVYVGIQPPFDAQAGLMALLGGYVGASFTYLFGQNSATAAVRTYQAGLNTPTPPTVTSTIPLTPHPTDPLP